MKEFTKDNLPESWVVDISKLQGKDLEIFKHIFRVLSGEDSELHKQFYGHIRGKYCCVTNVTTKHLLTFPDFLKLVTVEEAKEFTKDNLPEIGEIVELHSHADHWYEREYLGFDPEYNCWLCRSTDDPEQVGRWSGRCRPIPKYTPKFGDFVECPDGRIGLVRGLEEDGDYLINFTLDCENWLYYSSRNLKPSTREAWEEQQNKTK